MSWIRNLLRAFQLAFRSVNAVRWKSLISMITIFIGSLAITTTFTISKNIDGYVKYLIDINGGPKVSAFNYSVNEQFTKHEIEKFKTVNVVKKVYGTDESNTNGRHIDKNVSLKLVAVTDENWKHLPVKMKAGVFISPLDQKYSNNTVVLSVEAIKKFDLVPALGKYINVKLKGAGEVALKIIGIAESTGNDYDQGTAWVNFPLYRDITGKKAVTQLHIVSTGAEWMNWVENFGQLLFKEKFGSNIWVYNPLQQFIEQKNQLGTFIQMGYILGFLALIAGSIGSTSVMILNVNLRKREIGLYKSLGFSPAIILLQFTCETLILSLLGGLVGAISGSFIGLLISQDMFPVAELSFMGFILGLASALTTGLCFGLIPAVLAAKTDPVKALQG